MKFLKPLSLIIGIFFLLLLGIAPLVEFSGIKQQWNRQASDLLGLPVKIGWIYWNPFAPLKGIFIQEVLLGETAACNSSQSNDSSIKISTLSFDIIPLLKNLVTSEKKSSWSTTLEIEKLIFSAHIKDHEESHLVLQKLQAHLLHQEKKFSIDHINAQIAGGVMEGACLFQQSEAGHQEATHYELMAKATGLSLKELLAQTELREHVFSGIGQGEIKVSGIVGQPESLQGTGVLESFKVSIKSPELLAQCGQLLSIEELQTIKLREARGGFTFFHDHLVMNSLRLVSESVILQGEGEVSAKGLMNLKAHLLMKNAIASKLSFFFPQSMSPSSEPGYQDVPFNVSVPLDHAYDTFFNNNLLKTLKNHFGNLMNSLLSFSHH